MVNNSGNTYTLGSKSYRLEPELRKLLRMNNVNRNDIEAEYLLMKSYTPGLKIANYNHAAYSALVKKMGGR